MPDCVLGYQIKAVSDKCMILVRAGAKRIEAQMRAASPHVAPRMSPDLGWVIDN